LKEGYRGKYQNEGAWIETEKHAKPPDKF